MRHIACRTATRHCFRDEALDALRSASTASRDVLPCLLGKMNLAYYRTMDSPTEVSRRLIVGITGASGVIYGVRLLQVLRNTPVETHLVISRAGEIAVANEVSLKLAELRAMASVYYRIDDIAAPLASGSYRTAGMVIAPCSIRTMSEIATGVTTTLLTRAADVVLKERRCLVLMVRETPLHTGHLRTMLALSEMGAIIAPPVPAFYAKPTSIDDMIDHTVGRVLDLFDIDTDLAYRWRDPD